MIVLLTKTEILDACVEWVGKHHGLKAKVEVYPQLEYDSHNAIEVDVFARIEIEKDKGEGPKSPYRG